MWADGMATRRAPMSAAPTTSSMRPLALIERTGVAARIVIARRT